MHDCCGVTFAIATTLHYTTFLYLLLYYCIHLLNIMCVFCSGLGRCFLGPMMTLAQNWRSTTKSIGHTVAHHHSLINGHVSLLLLISLLCMLYVYDCSYVLMRKTILYKYYYIYLCRNETNKKRWRRDKVGSH